MTLLVPWLLFPLVLAVLAAGCGILLERTAGVTLPRALLLPAGFAVVITSAQLAVATAATAQFAVPLVLALAVLGIGLALPWHFSLRRDQLWAPAVAAAVFAVFAAPTVLSGEATFAGYVKLDDTATWFALTDRVLEHSRSLSGLAPSSYEATLAVNLVNGYPVGSLLPLGVGRALVGQDVAWVFQPYLAFVAALLALGLYTLVAGVVRSRRLLALAVFLAAQPALLYGFSLWGGVKELVAALLVVVVVALASLLLRGPVHWRATLPLAVASAAVLSVLSLGGAVWLAPAFAVALVALTRRGRRVLAIAASSLATFTLVLSSPSLATAGSFLRTDNVALFQSGSELGNLVRPLSALQVFGIWPTGDFRLAPEDLASAHLLVALVALAAAAGTYYAWRRHAVGVVLYLVSAVVGCAVVVSVGSPWVDAKALATASPGLLTVALLGAVAAIDAGRRVEGGFALVGLAVGIFWSNALAYHEAWLAPRDQLVELEQIGERFAGDGPTLTTEYQPYAVRHFLRKLDAEGASELRRRPVPLRSGAVLGKAAYANLDQFQLDAIFVYRTLVLRRSPVESRPPAAYRLVWTGRYYDVWQRDQPPNPLVLGHLAVGDSAQPTGRPRCDAVLQLARQTKHSELAYVVRPRAQMLQLGRAARPADWPADGSDPGVVYPGGPGSAEATAAVSRRGHYEVWLGGSFRRQIEILVDGTVVGSHRHELNNTAQWTPFGEISLTKGTHRIEVRYEADDLRPGGGGTAFGIGPLALAETTNLDVRLADRAAARSICGAEVDWVEALGL